MIHNYKYLMRAVDIIKILHILVLKKYRILGNINI